MTTIGMLPFYNMYDRFLSLVSRAEDRKRPLVDMDGDDPDAMQT